MLRASLVALGIAMVLLWIVGLVDNATPWVVWLGGVAAVLTFLLVPVTRDDVGPIGVSLGPNLIGLGLLAVFIVAEVTHASAWITWFTFAFSVGYLMLAAFAFMVRAFEPSAESRRPITEL